MRRAFIGSLLAVIALAFATTAVAEVRMRGAQARIQRAAPVPPPEEDDGYFSGYVTGPAGTRVPVMQVPGSTTVVTRKMMDDFQSRSVCDALRMAPGVTTSGCW